MVLEALQKTDTKLPKSLFFLLVQKELDHILSLELDDSTLDAYISVVSPWATPLEKKSQFDLMAPRLRDIEAPCEQKLSRFDKSLIDMVLVPAILDDQGGGPKVRAIVHKCSIHFEAVDALNLGAKDAAYLCDFLETLRALRGIFASWTEMLEVSDELESMYDNIGKDSSMPSAVVANAVRQSPYYDTLKLFLEKAGTLKVALPQVREVTAQLSIATLATMPDLLKAASQIMINFVEHVLGKCLDEFVDMIKAKSSEFFGMVRNAAVNGAGHELGARDAVMRSHADAVG